MEAQLRARPDMREVDIVTLPPPLASAISWRGRGHYGEAWFYTGDTHIRSIRLSFSRAFTFKQVKAAFGNPSHLYVGMNAPFRMHPGDPIPPPYWLVMVYMPQGFAFATDSFSVERGRRILEEFQANEVIFFDPTEEAFANAVLSIDQADQRLVAWQDGYALRDYCLAAYAGDEQAARCPPEE